MSNNDNNNNNDELTFPVPGKDFEAGWIGMIMGHIMSISNNLRSDALINVEVLKLQTMFAIAMLPDPKERDKIRSGWATLEDQMIDDAKDIDGNIHADIRIQQKRMAAIRALESVIDYLDLSNGMNKNNMISLLDVVMNND